MKTKTVTTYVIFNEDETQDQFFTTIKAATAFIKANDKQARVVEFQGKEFGKGKQVAEYAYNGKKLVVVETCYREGCTSNGVFFLGVCDTCSKKYGIHNNHDKVYPRLQDEETKEITEGNYIYE